MEMRERDTYVWMAAGRYGMSALSTVLDAALNGEKAKTKYAEKSMMEEIEEVPKTQDDRDKLLREWERQRRIDKLNFDLWKIEREKYERNNR